MKIASTAPEGHTRHSHGPAIPRRDAPVSSGSQIKSSRAVSAALSPTLCTRAALAAPVALTGNSSLLKIARRERATLLALRRTLVGDQVAQLAVERFGGDVRIDGNSLLVH
jgi:hypothetical protein